MKETTLNEVGEKLISVVPTFFKKLIKPLDQQTKNFMSPLQMQALETLYGLEKCTMTELSTELEISKQQTTPIVDKLIKMKFVIREHDDMDRRAINIRLTPSGLTFIKNFREDILKTAKGKIENLDEDDLLCLNNALNDLFKVIHKIP